MESTLETLSPPIKKKILIAEDVEGLIHILELEVHRLGFETILAKNGKDAVEMAEAQLPDLIMMDIMMPGMDGLEAVRRIRENPRTKNIPVIAVTALGRRKDKKKALENGCNDYLTKPFTASQLSSSIRKLLDQRVD